MRNQNQSLKTNRLLIVILVLVVLILVLLGFIATQFFTSSEEETTQSSQLLSGTTETSASTTSIPETSVSSTTTSCEEAITSETPSPNDFPYAVRLKPNSFYTSSFSTTDAWVSLGNDPRIIDVRYDKYFTPKDQYKEYQVNQSFSLHSKPTKEIRVIVGNGEKTVKVNTMLEIYSHDGRSYDDVTTLFFSLFNATNRRDSYLYTTNQGYVAIAFPVDDPGLYEEFILIPDEKE
ncbi:hypothetical protein RU97_GL001257 [Enterococcus canis]|uniref:Uncharacterized protein n=1 Tax=Enterococcus canis TaxID=214095 RepID=A0A1L8RIV3_9ENTE|nr:hypothetical protein [Enterococcus canis]OJG19686.1 hypothetical protein RU97_GL001257 [Enterococcus canis]